MPSQFGTVDAKNQLNSYNVDVASHNQDASGVDPTTNKDIQAITHVH